MARCAALHSIGLLVLSACVHQAVRSPEPTMSPSDATTPSSSPVVSYQPIGVIRSPFQEQRGTPIQPRFAGPARGRIVVAEPYRAALADLAGFERVWLVYDFDRAGPFTPLVTPYRDDQVRGLFATRAPTRPNRIGMSAVKLIEVVDDGLVVEEIDVLDGTPLLDIKPYVPAFDAYPDSRAGWLDETRSDRVRADDRFTRDERE